MPLSIERKAAINRILAHVTGSTGDFTRDTTLIDKALAAITTLPWNHKKMRFSAMHSSKGWKFSLQCAGQIDSGHCEDYGETAAEILALSFGSTLQHMEYCVNSTSQYLLNNTHLSPVTRKKCQDEVDLALDHIRQLKAIESQVGGFALPD